MNNPQPAKTISADNATALEFSRRQFIYTYPDPDHTYYDGLNINPIQFGSGPFYSRVDVLQFKDLGFCDATSNRRLAGTTAQKSGWHCFSVQRRPILHCGYDVQAGQMVGFFPDDRDYHYVTGDDAWSFDISIHDSLLQELGLQLPEQRNRTPELAVYPTSANTIRELELVSAAAFGPNSMLDSQQFGTQMALAVRENLLDLMRRLLSGLDYPKIEHPPVKKIARFDLVMAAMELIEFGDHESMTVETIARTLGVTPRAIQYAFRNSGLAGPAQYILAHKLNRSRRDLVTAGQFDITVTQAAMDSGFTNLGRFSGHYRRLFGELPSQTLRNAAALNLVD